MSDPTSAGATSGAQDKPGGVPPLVDQLAKVANHWVSVQSDLAKKCLQQWPAVNAWGSPVSGEDLWVSWIDSLGDMAQAWFTWVQIFDVMAGSGWAQGSSTSATTGQSGDTFRIPGNDEADIALNSLENVDTEAILKGKISLSRTHIFPNDRVVTVSVTPDKVDLPGRYFGVIVDANTQTPLMQIDLVVGTSS